MFLKRCLVPLAGLLLAACNPTPQKALPTPPVSQNADLEKRIDAQQAEIDSLKAQINKPAPPKPVPAPKNPEPQNPESVAPVLRTGTHSLTLQWIGWDRPGKATVKKTADGRYRIEGEQRKGKDYLQINGFLKPISATELSFDGKLVYRISHNNGGKPCDKSGMQTFLSTKGRKYWRLQDMRNCDGIATDYVDIYF